MGRVPAGPPIGAPPASSLADLVETARQGVVHVRAIVPDAVRGGTATNAVLSVGSGFFVDRSGLLVTNEHVIRGAVDIRVRLFDGRELSACVTGLDALTDIALLGMKRTLPESFFCRLHAPMEEKLYRQMVDDVFRRIDAAFETVDPDLAESTLSQGTLTIVFREKLELILSPQTPVRQIWAAFRDRAWHFGLATDGGAWIDDRGQGIDLFHLIEDLARSNAGVTVAIQ